MSTALEQAPPGVRRPSGLAYVVIIALALTVVMSIWSLVVRFDRASYVSGLLDRTITFSREAAEHQDNRVHSAVIATLLTELVTAGVFIGWFATLVRRLHALRPGEFRHRAGWAIGAWFVPILNLIRPKQIADDAWHAAAGRAVRVPGAFHLWWALYLIGNATTYIGSRLTDSDDPDMLMTGDRLAGAGHGISALAAILAIVVVVRLDAAARNAPALAAQPAQVAPPGLAFNPPPGWPVPPAGWGPPPGWQPDPAWPPAPPGWQFWVPVAPD